MYSAETEVSLSFLFVSKDQILEKKNYIMLSFCRCVLLYLVGCFVKKGRLPKWVEHKVVKNIFMLSQSNQEGWINKRSPRNLEIRVIAFSCPIHHAVHLEM